MSYSIQPGSSSGTMFTKINTLLTMIGTEARDISNLFTTVQIS